MISNLLKLYIALTTIDELLDRTNLDYMGLTDETKELLVRGMQEARGEVSDNLKKLAKSDLRLLLDIR